MVSAILGSGLVVAIVPRLFWGIVEWVKGRPRKKREIQKEIAEELKKERAAHFDAITTLYDALRELHKAGVDQTIIDALKDRVSEDKPHND
ncbi:MAG: hypothetical protein QM234_04455 [Acidobacteriota bacterium]|nr:hypothetical protein [Acidobacteriota bacterium]